VESPVIPHTVPSDTVLVGAKVHRTGKDPLEAVYQSAVMASIFRQAKIVEDLSS
jgi:hypothetical protein